MSYFGNKKPNIAPILLRMVTNKKFGLLGKMWQVRSLRSGMIQAKKKRELYRRSENLQVPFGIGLSPTMRCNLECKGCYARFHSSSEEMSISTIERTIEEATRMGVFLFVITGGEPYLREEMISLYEHYPNALFITVTNGSVMDRDTAKRLAVSGNVFPIVSIEGSEEQTDTRRGSGTYAQVMRCMQLLNEYKLIFGFSSVVTRFSAETLVSREFVRSMVDRGCVIGFYNDLIPYSESDRKALMDNVQLAAFKEQLQQVRRQEPLVLLHLPEDEYDREGRCTAVGKGSVHINARGDVEPCPFAHFARENVNTHSFRDILHSPFLDAIREHPIALLHGDIGCSLFNNYTIMCEIAEQTGAHCTEQASDHSLRP